MNRPLTEVETKLFERLLSDADRTDLIPTLGKRLAQEMEDGGMGGLDFQSALERRFGSQVAAADFAHADGVTVSASLNQNKQELAGCL